MKRSDKKLKEEGKFKVDAKKLGRKIKIARISMGQTQASMAEEIGATQKSISRYEAGKALPTLETLENICIFLERPFSYFLDN